jgi:nitroreductase
VASEKPGGLPIPYRAESIDAFLEVLQGRRSIRTGFLRDKPVPDKLMEKILEAARWGPSGSPGIIRSLEIREKIVEIFKTQNARQDGNRGGVARPAPPRECRCGLLANKIP